MIVEETRKFAENGPVISKDDVEIQIVYTGRKRLINGGEGEGNEDLEGETVTTISSNASTSTTEDKDGFPDGLKWPRRLVYMTMLLHGVGTLLPWNTIINAKDYFVNFKLSPNYTNSNEEDAGYYARNFLPDIGLASQIPSLCFTWANLFIRFRGTPRKRIIISLSVEAVLFLFTMSLAALDTSSWTPSSFFWVTIFTVVLMNTFSAIHQNSVFAIGGLVGHAEALIIGANISGTLISTMNLISMASAPSKDKAAVVYFSIALVVLLACIGSYLLLEQNRYYRMQCAQTESADNPELKQETPYLEVLKQCWPQCLNVFLVFFVTLSVFPTVHSDVKRADESFFIPEGYYVEVMCFFTFNFFSMVGSPLTATFKFPGPRHLWIAVVLRFIFIPVFLLCNYQPHGVTRVFFPNYVFGDGAFWFFGMLLGLTSGYFSSLAMVYCPRSVKDPNHAPLASMFGAACLVLGVCLGINFSRVMPLIVGAVAISN